MTGGVLRLGGPDLSVPVLLAWLGSPARVELAATVEPALAATRDQARHAARTYAAYGRTTGVGANRDRAAEDDDGAHGLRLVRSHAAGAGRDLGAEVARATMLVRAHQLSQPGSGIDPAIVSALVRAINDGRSPAYREHGAVGTGDLTVLAELALCLLGEMPWRDGAVAGYGVRVTADDALAFMSSSAPTLAAGALAWRALDEVARAAAAIEAIGAFAVRANRQHVSEVAVGLRPTPGIEAVGRALREALADARYEHARTQDSLSWRSIPYIHGPLLDATTALRDELGASISRAVENPRYTGGAVWHHGAFHLTGLALALDRARLALAQWAHSSFARTTSLNDPETTGQGRFLAHGPAGSSGVMVLEYAAASALATVVHRADPLTRQSITMSIGVEDHAPWTTQSCAALADAAAAARVVACAELVTAVRAARHAPVAEPGPAIAALLEACDPLPRALEDRPLVDDMQIADGLLSSLAGWLG